MADLGNRANLNTAIDTLLDDAQPNEAIQPSDHNTLLKNALDTVANGLSNTLRTNPETSGQDLEVTSGDKVKFKHSTFFGSIVSGTLTADRTYTLPDNTGTIALLSDITGGDSIYTADDTIGSGRVATLTDSLRFDNVGTTSSDFIEFKHANNASLLTFLRFYNALESKYTDIGCAGNTSIFNIKSNTNNVADFQSNRTFFYGASSGYIKLETNVSGADNWKLMADRQNQGQGFNIENETTGNYGLHIKKDNTFIVRAYNAISTEDISLQGSTLVNDKFEIQTTTEGMLMPRLTTAQMNAISSPDTNLLIFNTDLTAFYRYNGSSWVAMSTGYGIIEIKDSTGTPTFYADLQTALETCKTGTNTVNIHSNIALSAQININYSGSGVGTGYNFDNLTINLNGFTLSYDGANGDSVIDADLFSTPPNLKIINGQIIRTNATSGYSLSFQRTTFHASNLIVDSNKSCLEMGTISTNAYLGGSYFIARGTTEAVKTNTGTIKDFVAINTSSGIAFYMASSVAQNFYCESDSGAALRVLSGNADNFKAHSNSGYGVWHSSSTTCKLTNFEASSNSSAGIRRSGYGASTWHLSNFRVLNGGIQLDGSITTSRFSNFTVFCDFNTSLRGQVHGLNFYNGTFESDGAYHTSVIGLNNKLENVSFIGNDFETINFIDVGNVNNSVLKNCNFTCLLDTSSGHAIDVGGIDGGNIYFMNCTFEVVNSGANCITSGDAETITVLNSSFKGATTPINANVTITASSDENNGNRSI